MTTESAFLNAILDEADDDTSRLVFADWLEDNGQADRAEFLRLQCELANWIPERARREQKQERERELLAEHARDWLGPLLDFPVSWHFERGLAHLTLDAEVLLDQLPDQAVDWFRSAWIQRVRLENCVGRMAALAKCSLIRAIPELDLSRAHLGREELAGAFESKVFNRLRGLDLSNNEIPREVMLELLTGESLQQLRWLDLRNNRIWLEASDQRFILFASRRLRIDLSGNPAGLPIEGTSARGECALRKPGAVLVNSIGMRLAFIPAGSQWMGAPENEEGSFANERPRHEVILSRPFHLGVFPVTQFEYEMIMGEDPSHFHPTSGFGPFHPVEDVTWDEAGAFCKRLSNLPGERKAGRVYRLPTEAEWEYACRAGTTTPFHFGASLNSSLANFGGSQVYARDEPNSTRGMTTPVGSYPANPFGLYDVHGNVWEWVHDFYSPNYYVHQPMKDPTGPAQGTDHVLRGGSWYIVSRGCRSAERCYTNEAPVTQMGSIGFRVAMDA